MIIPAAVALVLTCLHHPVALAWGPGGGVPGIPGFSALWDEPKPKAIGQETKKCWSGDPAGRRSGQSEEKSVARCESGAGSIQPLAFAPNCRGP